MFTGIIEEVGTVVAMDAAGDRARLTIACPQVSAGLRVGDSLAVDGCCLTVENVAPDVVAADLMAETLRITALGGLAVGEKVNLERAIPADGRFGGHLVQGHVDAVGRLVDRRERPGTLTLTIQAPYDVARYLVAKGSVSVQGVSLTVVDVTDDPRGIDARFDVGIIPHTARSTVLGTLPPGAKVNLEADMLAKYVERLLVIKE